MNLWVNRVRQLAPLAVALFFFSCEDETSNLGFKNPNSKFKSYTIDIPLESSVVQMDSSRTSNFVLLNETNRLLVGSYNDPEVGRVSSTAITQYFRASSEKLPADAIYDSASLHLSYDLYFYGNETTAQQTFTVHEVGEELFGVNRRKYIYRTPVAINETPIGSRTLQINPKLIRENARPANNEPAKPDTLKIRLDEFYGKTLWESALQYRVGVSQHFNVFSEFSKIYKGIAIRGSIENSIMIGFTAGGASGVVLHYHTPTKNKQRIFLPFGQLQFLSYNHIQTDRSSTAIDGLNFFEEFVPANNKRYIQAGTGLVTKVSFDNFLNFADTVTGDIIINEAELVIEGVDDTENIPAPDALVLRTLRDDNRFRKLSFARTPGSADSLDLARFKGYVRRDYEFYTQNSPSVAVIESDDAGYVINDTGSGTLLGFNTSKNRYTGYPTMFFQQLYRNRETPSFKDFAIVPLVSSSGPSTLKSVHRVVFPAENLKLRIKYTQPIVND